MEYHICILCCIFMIFHSCQVHWHWLDAVLNFNHLYPFGNGIKCLVCSAWDPWFEWPALLCMFLDGACSLCSVFSGSHCTSTAFEFWHKRTKVSWLASNYAIPYVENLNHRPVCLQIIYFLMFGNLEVYYLVALDFFALSALFCPSGFVFLLPSGMWHHWCCTGTRIYDDDV